jgi:hypothetical protein
VGRDRRFRLIHANPARELPRLFPSPRRFGVAFYDPPYVIPKNDDINPDYDALGSVLDSVQRW